MNAGRPRISRFLLMLLRTSRYICWLVGFATLIFALVNAAAYLILPRFAPARAPDVFGEVIQPGSAEGAKLLMQVFGAADRDAVLRRLNDAPAFEMHPGLHFMTARIRNRSYQMGLEGIRYDAGWDDSTVSALLKGKRDLLFLMGGSTVLGHGVAGDETISWHLNHAFGANPNRVALNLGGQAYDQQRSIEKLVYLLRSGYRPRWVVFLEGWNDIAGLARSNMRWQDKVVYHGFSSNRGEMAFTPGAEMGRVNHARLFLEGLPVMRLLDARQRSTFGAQNVNVARNPFLQGFDFREAEWMFLNWEFYAERNAASLKEQLVASFRYNLAFIDGLARAFGFRCEVLLQPMGMFDEENPFVPESIRKRFGYRFLSDARDELRTAINRGELAIIDASDTLANIPSPRYVDVVHYSPAANAELARFIDSRINRYASADGRGRMRRDASSSDR